MKKILGSLSLVALVLLIASCSAGKSLSPPFYETEESVKTLQHIEEFGHSTTQIDGKPLHLVHTGSKTSPPILFVHGSPGDWEAWAQYLSDPDLRAKSFMMAVDRPGYGGSNDGTNAHSLATQSAYIMQAVREQIPGQQKIIIIGHSYGGPVALRMAADYPDQVASTILLAPAIAPDLVNVRWYNRLAKLWLVKAILPTAVHHSNQEMLPLKGELLTLYPDLPNITAPTSVIQGDKDWIVLPGNADFAETELPNAPVETKILPKSGHFIPWKNYDLVKKTLLEHLESYSDR